jgi:hypothetical protein
MRKMNLREDEREPLRHHYSGTYFRVVSTLNLAPLQHLRNVPFAQRTIPDPLT